MRGFLLDEKGDIVIQNGNIGVVSDNELKAQTLRTVIGTNRGEWFLNDEEGVDFDYLLGKGVTEEMLLTQMKEATKQVDENLHISDFHVDVDKNKRLTTVTFVAKSGDNALLTITKTYGTDDYAETNEDATTKLANANSELTAYRSATTRLENRLNGM